MEGEGLAATAVQRSLQGKAGNNPKQRLSALHSAASSRSSSAASLPAKSSAPQVCTVSTWSVHGQCVVREICLCVLLTATGIQTSLRCPPVHVCVYCLRWFTGMTVVFKVGFDIKCILSELHCACRGGRLGVTKHPECSSILTTSRSRRTGRMTCRKRAMKRYTLQQHHN